MDTIVALATGTGGAISIIRLSGDDAIRIADTLFRPATGIPLSEKEGYTISYGHFADPESGEVVDQVLVSLLRNPRSYTGEDMVEISTHASPYICKRVIDLLINAGARPAEAGEFTVRAFLAGKMDLSQAEAVADIIASTDRATHQLAINQIRGGYSSELDILREELVRLVSLLELELDFSDEDVQFADREQLTGIVMRIQARINELISSFSLGNALKEGIPVAITGKPNVGKSTLLNTLVREDRAMVSDIAGTTRDVIEENIVLNGVRFRFLDTAGIRDTADPLEKMGIERAYNSIQRAHIILWMVDAADYLAAVDSNDSQSLHPPFPVREEQYLYLVINKIDKLTKQQADRLSSRELTTGNGPVPSILISAKTHINTHAVTRLLMSVNELSPLYAGSTIVSHARHHEALVRANESLARARQSLVEGISSDLLAEDIRQTLHHLGTITGKITTDEILGSIFSKFCIGK